MYQVSSFDPISADARDLAAVRALEVNVMKTTSAVSLMLLMFASTVAADVSSGEAKRLNNAATVLRELRATHDIPDDTWNKAECIAVIPDLKKAAFVVGGEYGKGVMSCRSGRTWSSPVFIELEKGSAGFQIGGEEIDLVLLMMNRRGVEKLLGDKVTLGGDASVAAGPVGRTAAASTDARLTAEILSYSRSKGVFAGIDVSGGVLRPDKDANADAYGRATSARDVLLGNKVTPPPAAQAFLRTLESETRATSGHK
jgi:lipid-binding SYLF domain-containing protein